MFYRFPAGDLFRPTRIHAAERDLLGILNAIKLTSGWPIQLSYWDYVAGILLASVIWGHYSGGRRRCPFPRHCRG